MQGRSLPGLEVGVVVVVVVIDLSVTLDVKSIGVVGVGVEDTIVTTGSSVSLVTFRVSLSLKVELTGLASVILNNCSRSFSHSWSSKRS